MEMIWDQTPLTLADVCAALMERRVPATTRDGYVEVRVRDLRRLCYDDLMRHTLTTTPVDCQDCQPLDASSLA